MTVRSMTGPPPPGRSSPPESAVTSLVFPSIAGALAHGYTEVADPDDLYHSPQWLGMDEEVKIARPFSVISQAAGAGAPAMAATWGLAVEDTAFWPFMRIDTVLSRLIGEQDLAHGPDVTRALDSLMPSAYLGALRGGTTRLQVRPGLGPGQTQEALGEVLRGAEEMARAEGLHSIACFYVPADDLPLRQALDDQDYMCFGLAHHVSVLPVTRFDDYVGGMTKGRRDNIRWERRKIAQAGVEISLEPLSRELSEQMLPLEAQLYLKYGHESHPTQMARILHHQVIETFPGHAPVITARRDGILRGYAAFIQAGRVLYSRDVGFDYTWEPRLPIYFEVVFYAAVELAARLGAELINYSYAAEDTKISHGCHLLPRVGYVKAFDPAVAAALLRLGLRSDPPGQADESRTW